MEDSSTAARLFITGGTGFIGSQLAQFARARGLRVTVASPINNANEKFRSDMLARAGITIIDATLDDSPRLREALAGHDAVIHLAAAQHEAEAAESHFHKVNVEGTRNLLTLAREAKVRRFVHGSTIGVYGAAGESVLDESSPLAPDNPYGRTKAEAETVVRALSDYGMAVDVHDPWADPDDALAEYDLKLVAQPAAGAYEAVVVAVSHQTFRELGPETIRAFGKPGSVMFDVKAMFPKAASDLRL